MDRGVVDESEATGESVLEVVEQVLQEQRPVDGTRPTGHDRAVVVVGGVQQFADNCGCDQRVEVGVFRRDLAKELGVP